VVEELIPTSKRMDSNQTIDLATIGFLIGFVIMMILDVALG
jgi:zinc transporter ZupT